MEGVGKNEEVVGGFAEGGEECSARVGGGTLEPGLEDGIGFAIFPPSFGMNHNLLYGANVFLGKYARVLFYSP
jgi:hypothetical protein